MLILVVCLCTAPLCLQTSWHSLGQSRVLPLTRNQTPSKRMLNYINVPHITLTQNHMDIIISFTSKSHHLTLKISFTNQSQYPKHSGPQIDRTFTWKKYTSPLIQNVIGKTMPQIYLFGDHGPNHVNPLQIQLGTACTAVTAVTAARWSTG